MRFARIIATVAFLVAPSGVLAQVSRPIEGSYRTNTLLSATITTAVTGTTTTAVTNLSGVKSATVQSVFTYGSSGTTGKFWVQTSCDGGTTWIDVANHAVTTASETRLYHLSDATAITTAYTPTDGTLTDDTSKDGILCSQFRVKYTTTGTYATSTTILITLVTKG